MVALHHGAGMPSMPELLRHRVPEHLDAVARPPRRRPPPTARERRRQPIALGPESRCDGNSRPPPGAPPPRPPVVPDEDSQRCSLVARSHRLPFLDEQAVRPARMSGRRRSTSAIPARPARRRLLPLFDDAAENVAECARRFATCSTTTRDDPAADAGPRDVEKLVNLINDCERAATRSPARSCAASTPPSSPRSTGRTSTPSPRSSTTSSTTCRPPPTCSCCTTSSSRCPRCATRPTCSCEGGGGERRADRQAADD